LLLLHQLPVLADRIYGPVVRIQGGNEDVPDVVRRDGELERMVIFPDTRSGRMKLRCVNWLTNWITSVRSRLSNDITTVRAPVRMSLLSTGGVAGGCVERVAAGWPGAGGSTGRSAGRSAGGCGPG